MMTRMNFSSSRPYNITTGRDDNFDTQINDRPAGLARNSGEGPSQFNLGMNFSKTVTLRSSESSAPGAASNTAVTSFAQRGGGGGGFPGGGGDGGGQRGNFPGGGQRGGGRGNQGDDPRNPNFNQVRNMTMTFSLNVDNLLNNVQYSGYSGVMTSRFFGLPTNARNPRQIEASVRLNF
jgi:hypothetical protein